jgi:hypothetical protein
MRLSQFGALGLQSHMCNIGVSSGQGYWLSCFDDFNFALRASDYQIIITNSSYQTRDITFCSATVTEVLCYLLEVVKLLWLNIYAQVFPMFFHDHFPFFTKRSPRTAGSSCGWQGPRINSLGAWIAKKIKLPLCANRLANQIHYNTFRGMCQP